MQQIQLINQVKECLVVAAPKLFCFKDLISVLHFSDCQF